MKIRNIVFIGLSAALLALPSCKKDKETSSTKEYLNGSMSFTMPTYVSKGESFTLNPKGVTNPGTGLFEDVGFYWTSSWNSSVKDTTKTEADKKGDGSFTFTTPTKVGTFTVSCVAFAKNYYTGSRTVTFSVVDAALDSTVTGAYSSKDPVFTDPRDGGSYYTSTFNGKTWMKNNLYYSESGASYDYSEAMDAIFGRLYSWEEATQACPDGWHLPSNAEFAELANALAPEGVTFSKDEDFTGVAGGIMVDAKFLGTRMWEYWPQVKITNAAGLSALPVGYAVNQGEYLKFTGADSFAVFWTSDSYNDDSESDTALYRYIYVKQNDILLGKGDKESFKASVRCVKD